MDAQELTLGGKNVPVQCAEPECTTRTRNGSRELATQLRQAYAVDMQWSKTLFQRPYQQIIGGVQAFINLIHTTQEAAGEVPASPLELEEIILGQCKEVPQSLRDLLSWVVLLRHGCRQRHQFHGLIGWVPVPTISLPYATTTVPAGSVHYAVMHTYNHHLWFRGYTLAVENGEWCLGGPHNNIWLYDAAQVPGAHDIQRVRGAQQRRVQARRKHSGIDHQFFLPAIGCRLDVEDLRTMNVVLSLLRAFVGHVSFKEAGHALARLAARHDTTLDVVLQDPAAACGEEAVCRQWVHQREVAMANATQMSRVLLPTGYVLFSQCREDIPADVVQSSPEGFRVPVSYIATRPDRAALYERAEQCGCVEDLTVFTQQASYVQYSGHRVTDMRLEENAPASTPAVMKYTLNGRTKTANADQFVTKARRYFQPTVIETRSLPALRSAGASEVHVEHLQGARDGIGYNVSHEDLAPWYRSRIKPRHTRQQEQFSETAAE